MKDLLKVCPPVRDHVPSWDLILVLTMLVKSTFKPLAECSFYHLSTKMAFIIAVTSGRRVSKLNALMADPPFTSIHKDKVVLKSDLLVLTKGSV